MSLEKDIETITASLKQVNDQLKANAETAQKEIKAHAQMSEETKASVDKLLVQQGELQARLQAAEQLIVKMEGGGGAGRPKSMGEEFIAADGFDAFAAKAAGGAKGSFSVPVKAAVTSLDTSAGELIQPTRVGLIQPVQQRLFIRDLLSWGRTTSNS